MTWNQPRRRLATEISQDPQPAANTAVHDGNMVEKNEVAREQGFRRGVEHCQIAVAVRGRPRLQSKSPSAEIKLKRPVDQDSRWHNADLVDQIVTHNLAEGF